MVSLHYVVYSYGLDVNATNTISTINNPNNPICIISVS
nr:MAG TPA: hypothetical protein [Caudoviricetes sp.]